MMVTMIAVTVLLVACSAGVDAFSGIVNQQTRTQSRTGRQPSQRPSSSLLSPLSYLMREGDDEFIEGSINTNDDSTMTTTTTAPSTIIPTVTETSTDTTINLNINNYVDDKMIDDLQGQHDEHLQLMQMQMQQQQVPHQQQQQHSLLSYSVTDPLLPTILFPSTAAPTTAISLMMTMMSSTRTTTTTTAIATATATMNRNGHDKNGVGVGTYNKLHDDLNRLNMRLLLHRLFPNNKKQHIERLVNFLIKYIL